MPWFGLRSEFLRNPSSVSKRPAGAIKNCFSDLDFRKPAGSAPKDFSHAILKKILFVGGCLVALVWVPSAVAQVHGGRPVGGRVIAPPQAPISQPRVMPIPRTGPHSAGFGPRFPFGPRSFAPFRRRFFFGVPFFRLPVNSPYLSIWWPSCGPGLGWGSGIDCFPQPLYGYGFGNYLTPPAYETPLYPVYWYGGGDRDLVWLYLKDGTVYAVNDYWFANGQVHFTLIEDDPRKPVEHGVPSDQLDVEKTVFVNSRRGFRVVLRDKPWPQYLKEHPDSTPPDLAPEDKPETKD